MLFAAWVFTPTRRVRVAAILIVTLLAGHKALLLLPIWLMGVALQRSRALRRLNPTTNMAVWAGGLLIVSWVLATHAYDPAIKAMESLVSPWIVTQLAQARVFLFDWVLGLAVAAHFLGARTVASKLPLEWIARPVCWCAGVSFAAYLFHMPLLHFWASFLSADQGWLAIGLTLAVIAILGHTVERGKGWWRNQLNRVANLLPISTAVRSANLPR